MAQIPLELEKILEVQVLPFATRLLNMSPLQNEYLKYQLLFLFVLFSYEQILAKEDVTRGSLSTLRWDLLHHDANT